MIRVSIPSLRMEIIAIWLLINALLLLGLVILALIRR
jgi:hypothetical protein